MNWAVDWRIGRINNMSIDYYRDNYWDPRALLVNPTGDINGAVIDRKSCGLYFVVVNNVTWYKAITLTEALEAAEADFEKQYNTTEKLVWEKNKKKILEKLRKPHRNYKEMTWA